MTAIRWDRYPRVAALATARAWLTIQVNLGLAPSTVDGYGRDLDDYLAFCTASGIDPERATKEHVARYVRDLAQRPRSPRGQRAPSTMAAGLANATLQRRLTVARLYYDHLIEQQIRSNHPVGRGCYTVGKGFGGQRERGLIPHYQPQPWIPNDDQWTAILHATRDEPIRNRCMFALAYDAALRREEVCALCTDDIDPGHRLLHIRAETTKNRRARTVPYSAATGILYAAYLGARRTVSRARGPLFLSMSRRNYGQPISIWTWSKVIAGIADRASVPQFTTHTLRHLCLTDLARAGWDVHEIALFAGHRNTQTTLLYIHLSGRDLAAKLERGMQSLHTWRTTTMSETLR